MSTKLTKQSGHFRLKTAEPVPGWRKAVLAMTAPRDLVFQVTAVGSDDEMSIEGLKIGPHEHDPKQLPWPVCEPGWEIRVRVANNCATERWLFLYLTWEATGSTLPLGVWAAEEEIYTIL